MTVRRVLVHLFEPTRDKEVEVVLLTNLPLDDADAVVVSELYRTRWKIEITQAECVSRTSLYRLAA